MFGRPAGSPAVLDPADSGTEGIRRRDSQAVEESAANGSSRHLPPVVPALAFHNLPILSGALCFALGVLLSHWVWQPFALLFLAVALISMLTVFALQAVSGRVVLFPLAALWFSLGLFCAEMQPAPPTQAQLISYADGLDRKVTGRVIASGLLASTAAGSVDGPANRAARRDESATSVDLEVEAVEDVQPDRARMVPVQGGVRLTLYSRSTEIAPSFQCGELVELSAQLRPPERFFDAGAWDYAGYLLEHGIGATAAIPAGSLRVIESPARPSLTCTLHAIQQWAAGRINVYAASLANRSMPALLQLNAQDAGMLNAMLFGDRTHLDRTLRRGFERTGSFHLFVVSGLHLAVLAGLIFLLARRLRLPQLPSTLLTLALATGYALVTGFGLPVQRALAMTAIFLVARLMSRDRNPLNALGIAVLCLLAAHPRDLFDPSFQMTMLAIVAIAGVAVPLGERTFMPYERGARDLFEIELDHALQPRIAQFRITLRLLGRHAAGLLGRPGIALPATVVRWTLWGCELALVTCVAELFMVLPMAVYFHRITIFAIAANLISIPFVGILLPLVLLTFLCSLVSSWAALVPATFTAALLHLTTWFVTSLGRLHAADVRSPAPSLAAIAIVLAMWAFAIWAVRKQRVLAFAGVAVLLIAAAVVLWPEPPLFHRGALEVTAIDVGQGDSLLVVSPDGKTLLVDAGGPIGGPFATNSQFDIGEEVVSPYLWSRRIRRLDAVALTHAHSDHMGGMPAILRNFQPRELWVGNNPPDAGYRALLAEAKELGIPVRSFHAGDHFAFGATEIEVLSPAAGYHPARAAANDDSLVLDVRYGLASALLEGDAQASSERAMLRADEVRHATLLKAGHHGSLTSSTPQFLAAASPDAAVISVGRRNPFGHPRPEIIAEFAGDHIPLYRTDLMGASSFFLTRDGKVSASTFEAR